MEVSIGQGGYPRKSKQQKDFFKIDIAHVFGARTVLRNPDMPSYAWRTGNGWDQWIGINVNDCTMSKETMVT